MSYLHTVFVILDSLAACQSVHQEAESQVDHDYVDRAQIHYESACPEVSRLIPFVHCCAIFELEFKHPGVKVVSGEQVKLSDLEQLSFNYSGASWILYVYQGEKDCHLDEANGTHHCILSMFKELLPYLLEEFTDILSENLSHNTDLHGSISGSSRSSGCFSG